MNKAEEIYRQENNKGNLVVDFFIKTFVSSLQVYEDYVIII